MGNWFRDRPAWHNYNLETGQSIRQYPKVQYKILRNHLAFVVLAEEKKALLSLTAELPRTFWIEGKPKRLTFESLERFEHNFKQPASNTFYLMNNWLPMKSEQFRTYQQLCKSNNIETGQREINSPVLLRYFEGLLQTQLQYHFREFGVSQPLNLYLTNKNLYHFQTTYHKGLQFSMLKNVQFTTNIAWPIHLGIGIGCSIGYGMIRLKQGNSI